MSHVRRAVRFIGRVQGINFRRFVQNQADRLHVSGLVRNLPDGSVVGEFEGEEAAVAELVLRARREHPLAEVERVEEREMTPLGDADRLQVF